MHRHPLGPLLLALLGAACIWLWWSNQPLRHEPGVLTTNGPVQEDVPPRSLGERAGMKLTGVAYYTIRARVLDTKQYFSGLQADLAPYDVALGWGRMSDQSVLDRLTISMGNRFFFYQWQGRPPIPQEEIIRSAANNHLIPSTRDVATSIRHLRTGQIAEISGWLVDAAGPNHFTWRTSRRRDDTGNGACELIYVEKVEAWNEPPPAMPASPVFAVTR